VSVLSRRELLRSVVVVASPGVLFGCADANPLSLRASGGDEGGTRFFPQSVASGDPRPASVVLWTRVEDPERSGVAGGSPAAPPFAACFFHAALSTSQRA
jgi:alkaline phosphatase D